MIQLSKRLSAIAEMVPACHTLADVGTDHGYLPVRLLQEGIVNYVLASDINAGPLRRAKETAEEYALSDRMETILSDGLQYPGADRADTITICGMGGETMISILQAAPWTASHRRLILQPQSKLKELEHWLHENYYAIEDARLCLDGGKLYLALSVLGGGIWSRGAEQTLLEEQDSLLPEYLRRELQKVHHARNGLLKSSSDRNSAVSELEQRIDTLERMEKEITRW